MTSDVAAETWIVGLAQQIKASRLPVPAECRAIREQAGATLREIASEVGVTASAVQRWERGERKISREHAIAYRRVLDALREVTE